MANDFSGDSNCVALWKFESGALTTDSKGTAIVTLTFVDEDNNTVVPTSLAWQLSNKAGTVINTRTFALSTFTAGDVIVLKGNDLALADASDDGIRYFTVKGVYTSSAGSNLPLVGELQFTICSLVNIT